MKSSSIGKRSACHCSECPPDSFFEVFQLIDQVAKKLRSIHSQTIKEANLTPTQYYVFTLLSEKDGRPLKELAAMCRCTPATITGIVDTLEKKDLVKRQPNPTDRRSLLAMLTQKGKAFRRSTPTTTKVFENCCTGLNPNEFRQLSRLLKKFDLSLRNCATERTN